MKKIPITFLPWRFYFILIFITLVAVGLLVRIFDLAILDQRFLRLQGDERVLRLISTPAFRGMIVDRNGFPLAVSTTVYSAWMNPQEIELKQDSIMQLGRLLKIKPSVLTTSIKRYQHSRREFIYLKRSLSPEIAHDIKLLDIPGVYLQEEYRRFYPEGEVAAHVVGFTNIDDQGQEGLELAYNQWLQGEPGKKWVMKDRLGRVISEVQNVQEQKAGQDLVLSIDRRIQYLAYRELMAGVIENEAASGSAIVLDAQTGEILAMVNQPSFNPNKREGRRREAIRNRAITDTFEPGSTIKSFSLAYALAQGRVKLNTVIDTSPGWLRVGRNLVHDEKNNGLMTIMQIFQISSNVGITKMMLGLPPDPFWELLHQAGLGEETNVGFPGEQAGTLIKHDPWGAFTFATLTFGYGLSVTALQLAQAYLIFANHGMKLPLSLMRLEQAPAGQRVIDEKIADQVALAMESVLAKGGTAQVVKVPGYRVAGKTGTSQLVGEKGYERHHYNSSFVGFAPATHPRFVIAVVIRDPRGKHYLGGYVSGPVFARIMQGTLRLLNVPPDAA